MVEGSTRKDKNRLATSLLLTTSCRHLDTRQQCEKMGILGGLSLSTVMWHTQKDGAPRGAAHTPTTHPFALARKTKPSNSTQGHSR